MKKRRVALIILSLLAIFMCIPIVIIFSGSLMDNSELSKALSPILASGKGYVELKILPEYPTLRSIVELLLDTPQFFIMYWNSVKITLFILLGHLLIAVPAAWGFARFNFRFKKILFSIYIVVMLIPFQVTMLSSYLVLDKIHLINTQWSLILPGIFSTFPVFIMYRFFCSIPKEIIEAAKIDGASEFQVFTKIGIPVGLPGIVSAMVLGFIEYWNLIEQPLTFIKDKSLWPLSLYLPNISLENADVAFVASLVTMATSIIIFFAGQKYLKEGISVSAGKEN